MPPTVPVYLELGIRRVFAGALDWPGWCRSGRDEDSALQALVDYGPRYAGAVEPAARKIKVATGVSALDVVERVEGNSTTDFGAPGVAPAGDERPVNEPELKRLAGLLRACWAAFDAAAEAHSSAVLRKGPRGGGRELGAIVSHVLEAEGAYLARLGGRYRKAGDDVGAEMARLRDALLDALTSRSRGELPAQTRSARAVWSPRYFVRRSAWHALDHAWEIEDRATALPGERG